MPTLRLFAAVRQAAGVSVVEIGGDTVAEVLDAAAARFGPAFEEQLRGCRIWRNGEPADLAEAVAAGDEIAALPPVSGGAGRTGRVAVISLHTSPLVQPGSGDSGGMNVYVRELSAALAHRGLECSVYVRRYRDDLPPEISVEPGVRVVHIPAGPADLPKEALEGTLDAFTEGVLADLRLTGGVDAIHAHYWLSGVAGHRVKHAVDRPLVTTFHTLARVKQGLGEAESLARARAEEEVVACSDVICAAGPAETDHLVELYDAPADRVQIVAPGVEHALFSPGDPEGARAALGLGSEPVLLFVGRVQPLKGLDLAVQTLAALGARRGAPGCSSWGARAAARGAPSWHASASCRRGRSRRPGALRRPAAAPPARHLLPGRRRGPGAEQERDVRAGGVGGGGLRCSRVAAEVGGLKTLVRHGSTGYLVADRDPLSWAQRTEEILEDRLTAATMALEAAAAARDYSWDATAGLLAGCYDRLRQRRLVECLA